MTDTERIVLVQCTATKRDEPAAARDLYDESVYFRKQRAFAEAVADAWYVQSAEHGLLPPTAWVEPYNLRADDLDDPEAWASNIAADLADDHEPPARVDILGGAAYADPLTPELEVYGYDVHEPYRGMRIGERMAALGEVEG